jgi:hypothetical protein
VSEHVELTNPVDLSVGGMSGHLFRRGIHIGMAAVPFVFFEWGQDLADLVGADVPQVVSLIILAILAAEAIRLKMGFTIFGQRSYEAKQVSALAWGALASAWCFCWCQPKPTHGH